MFYPCTFQCKLKSHFRLIIQKQGTPQALLFQIVLQKQLFVVFTVQGRPDVSVLTCSTMLPDRRGTHTLWCISLSDENESKGSARGHCCHWVCVVLSLCDCWVGVYCQRWCIDGREDLITLKSQEQEKTIKKSHLLSSFLYSLFFLLLLFIDLLELVNHPSFISVLSTGNSWSQQ